METPGGAVTTKRWPLVITAGGTVLVVAAAAWMLLRGRSWEVLYVRWIVHNGLIGVAELWLGWAILRRWPRHGLGRLFLAAGTVSSAHVAIVAFADARFVAEGVGTEADLRLIPSELPLSAAVPYWMSSWLWLLVAGASIVLVLLLFPDGRLPSPRWWPVVAVTLVGTALLIVGFMLWTWPGSEHERLINEQPEGVPLVSPLITTGWSLLLVAMVGAIVSLGMRWRRAAAQERSQLRPVIVSGSLLGLVTVLLFPWQPVWIPTVLVLIVVFLAAYTFSVLRLRLHDIDVVINRTVAAAVLAALVMVVYLVVVVGVGSLVGRTGDHPLLPLVAVGLVATLFEPARRRVRRVVDRVLYGRDADAYELLSGLADQLRNAGSIETITDHVAQLVVRGTGAAGARILMHAEQGPRQLARAGDVDADPVLQVPVLHDGETLGDLRLYARSRADLAPDAQALVDNVAGTLGTVLRNARLTDALQAQVEALRGSRQRLVHAQDSARRDLERDLHDGAQARLVALRLQVGLAAAEAARLPDDQGTARLRDLLEKLGDETDVTIRSLRDLSRGLHPPVLESDGIAAALRAGTRGLPFDVEVAAPDLARFPPPVEAAVYFGCLEAIKNAATHAGARTVRVVLHGAGGWLHFEVADDGAGFDPATVVHGRGLANLEDRLGALDGHLTIWASPSRGTRIVGELPVQPLVSDR